MLVTDGVCEFSALVFRLSVAIMIGVRCLLSVLPIILSAQGDIWQSQSGKQIPWTNCGE